LIADEPTTALDVTVQKKSFNYWKIFSKKREWVSFLYLMIYHLFRDSASSFSDVPRRNCWTRRSKTNI
jgi:ABC-type dipeptide/oligopeptide/nickel transport system ATPase subunit